MDSTSKRVLWQQFGAAIDMLQNAILACPESLWGDRSQRPEFWYTAFHALFFLDYYVSNSEAGYHPPSPFTLDELDERGIIPDRVYSKEELLAFLERGRSNCRTAIQGLTEESARAKCGFSWLDLSVEEMMLYNMRHVQHHAAQLNMLLSQRGIPAPRWVRKTSE
ncbi:MAG: DinB family protein [Acidobacteriota bacterium]